MENIAVQRDLTGNWVTVTLPHAGAVELFHAIIRVLVIVDDAVARFALVKGDQEAYDLANDFIATLQRKLEIEPEGMPLPADGAK